MRFSQWSVWLANLDPIVGSEQGKTSPVLIISQTSLNKVLPVVNVIPVTSRKSNRRVYSNEALLAAATGGLTVYSIALWYQIRTVDKRRLVIRFGAATELEIRNEIFAALRFQLGMQW
jgi:mRNA interferase MazF